MQSDSMGKEMISIERFKRCENFRNAIRDDYTKNNKEIIQNTHCEDQSTIFKDMAHCLKGEKHH